MAAGVLMVAGEASADAHGARVLAHLSARHPGLEAFGVGGRALADAGLQRLAPAEIFAHVGITEVLASVPRLAGVMRRLVARARARRPAVAVLIDLPEFNLRLAPRLRRLGIPVVYYISPQLWAWRPGRVEIVRAAVDTMLCILPFEVPFYARHGVAAHFVGHPLVEQLAAAPAPAAARTQLGLAAPGQGPPVVALLPGSRRQEVERLLPPMLAALARLHARGLAARAVVPVASTVARARVEAAVAASGVGAAVQITAGGADVALAAADAAAVCSGTATLQAALLGCPMVVCYRVSWLTHALVRRLATVAHVALPNLIAGRALVPELLQDALTPDALAAALAAQLTDVAGRARLRAALRALGAGLGRGDTAAAVAAHVAPHLGAGRRAA